MVHGCGSIIMAVFWVLSALWGSYSFLVYVLNQEWWLALVITVALATLTFFGLTGED